MTLIISENSLWKVKNMTKQTKILISVVLSCTMLLFLFIPSFAEEPLPSSETRLLRAGTYVWNDDIIPPSSDFIVEDIPFSTDSITIPPTLGEWDILSVVIIDNEVVIGYGSTAQEVEIGVYNDSYGWSYGNIFSDGALPTGYGQTITILQNTYVSSDFASYVESNWTYLDEYDGNPFVDIMNLVIEALDVPIFGSFSLWDMLTTLCGLFAVVWLLKLLAGG